MHDQVKISELWALRLNPSDLYNIERSLDDNPVGGGGHTYIQIPKKQVEPMLNFINEKYPPNGTPIRLEVNDQTSPDAPSQQIEFWAKSAGRMRISQQNRHRHSRLDAWAPSRGFPSLEPNQGTEEAKQILIDIGGLHLYLARGPEGTVWAGYTTGAPSEAESKLPFANILWGSSSPGGYWRFTEET